jgi:hypothetical protein
MCILYCACRGVHTAVCDGHTHHTHCSSPYTSHSLLYCSLQTHRLTHTAYCYATRYMNGIIILPYAHCITIRPLYHHTPTVSPYVHCITIRPLYHHTPTVSPYVHCITIRPLYHHTPTVSPYAHCITIRPLYHHTPTVSPYVHCVNRLWAGKRQAGLGCI